MKSQEIASLNELIERLRLGDLEGTIEITINNKGKVNRILIKKKQESEENKDNDLVHTVKLFKPDLSHADLSGTDLSGSDFSGIDLHESNFSYSRIQYSDLSQSNLRESNFYKAHISQSDLSNTYGLNVDGAYVVGSVNLYGANSTSTPEVVNPLDAPFNHYHSNEDMVY